MLLPYPSFHRRLPLKWILNACRVTAGKTRTEYKSIRQMVEPLLEVEPVMDLSATLSKKALREHAHSAAPHLIANSLFVASSY